MVWKKERQIEKIEEVEKSGFSGKFSKETNFPKERENWIDIGQFDFEDHQLTEKGKNLLDSIQDVIYKLK